jgi:hypothetical protein
VLYRTKPLEGGKSNKITQSHHAKQIHLRVLYGTKPLEGVKSRKITQWRRANQNRSKPSIKQGQHIFTLESGILNVSHDGQRRTGNG